MTGGRPEIPKFPAWLEHKNKSELKETLLKHFTGKEGGEEAELAFHKKFKIHESADGELKLSHKDKSLGTEPFILSHIEVESKEGKEELKHNKLKCTMRELHPKKKLKTVNTGFIDKHGNSVGSRVQHIYNEDGNIKKIKVSLIKDNKERKAYTFTFNSKSVRPTEISGKEWKEN